jgi:hypothetical protein
VKTPQPTENRELIAFEEGERVGVVKSFKAYCLDGANRCDRPSREASTLPPDKTDFVCIDSVTFLPTRTRRWRRFITVLSAMPKTRLQSSFRHPQLAESLRLNPLLRSPCFFLWHAACFENWYLTARGRAIVSPNDCPCDVESNLLAGSPLAVNFINVGR